MQKIQIPILKGVVCGMEHAGTTLLAQLLRQHPHIETGYEVGALMHQSIEQFWNNTGVWKQYNDPNYRYGLEQGWKLGDVGRQAVRSAKDWQNFYGQLHAHSPLVRDKRSYLIDKTPPYQAVIDNIATRFDVPIVIIIKDPVLLFDSWYRRHQTQVIAMAQYYAGRAAATQRAKQLFPDQVFIIAYEDLVRFPGRVMDKVFTHIGVEPMLLPDTLDSDFPEKVPAQVINDIAMRLARVGQAKHQQFMRHIPQYCYLDAAGQVQSEKRWW